MRTNIVSQQANCRLEKHIEPNAKRLAKKDLLLQSKEGIEIENRVSLENKMAAQPKLQNIEEAILEMGKVSHAIRHDGTLAAKVHGDISSLRVLSLVE